MRKIILIIWIIVVIVSSGILAYSTLYEIDSYQTVLDFKLQITNVGINTNSTGQFDRISISGNFWNPSYFSSIRLKSIENNVRLNGQGSEYLRKLHWFTLLISPRTNRPLSLTITILPQNLGIFTEANSTSIWNWSFNLKVNLVSSIIEAGQYDRSQEFTGVTMIVS
ncbi:MAG: hypothetical protein ACW98F_17495 [Candidatus Hodarchaeales archaeon]